MPRRLSSSQWVLDDATKALIDRILSEPQVPRPRARAQLPVESAPAEPARVLVHAPPETPPELIEMAIACHPDNHQEPVLEPSKHPLARAGAEVVCMLCTRSPAIVSLPIRNQRCGYCGFRALVQLEHADAA